MKKNNECNCAQALELKERIATHKRTIATLHERVEVATALLSPNDYKHYIITCYGSHRDRAR